MTKRQDAWIFVQLGILSLDDIETGLRFSSVLNVKVSSALKKHYVRNPVVEKIDWFGCAYTPKKIMFIYKPATTRKVESWFKGSL